MGSVILRNEAGPLAAELHAQGQRIVLTNGCYDLLHIGHLRNLDAARGRGDVLFVGVNDDPVVRLLKGPERPFVPAGERVELVAGLTPVDFAFIFAEVTAGEIIREIRPDVYVKGGDYQLSSLPETDVALSCGVELVFLPTIPGCSTTGLAARIAAARGKFQEG